MPESAPRVRPALLRADIRHRNDRRAHGEPEFVRNPGLDGGQRLTRLFAHGCRKGDQSAVAAEHEGEVAAAKLCSASEEMTLAPAILTDL